MAAATTVTFSLSTRIFNGPGRVGLVGQLTRETGLTRVLLVTDPGVRAAGLVAPVETSLREAGVAVEVFDRVEPNPSVTSIEAGVARYGASQAAGLVALGGGSAIDAAKVIGIVVANGGQAADYEGADVGRLPSPPLVAIPTTAGTGSEVTFSAIISDPARRGKKMSISSRFNRPTVAIGDPELTLSLPPGPTAASGMDALTHAIESYTSRNAIPHTDANAIFAVRRIARCLPTAVTHGDDLEARTSMLMASQLAGIAFATAGLGIVHALDHPLTAFYHIPHGVANAILLPYAMEFNHEHALERYADVAEALGVPRHGQSDRALALEGAARVRELTEAAGIPTTLRAAGAADDEIELMAQEVMTSRVLPLNPRPLTFEDAVRLYERAMDGT
ncbi:MAG: iron-containing alcohol dehydrogenase [Chloroflexi bacterium]|nr:iron-containing alcohol dehydrogenase [Chloroflexota bacterium]